YQRQSPRLGILHVLAEAFGLTDDRHEYVHLSDGGHFDNLGLYEMVRRRCHFVIVSDVGRDDKYTFEDLGNAIRKIRIDLGINVELDGIKFFPESLGKKGYYCATGRIRYSQVDGTPSNRAGFVIYIESIPAND